MGGMTQDIRQPIDIGRGDNHRRSREECRLCRPHGQSAAKDRVSPPPYALSMFFTVLAQSF